MSECLRIDTEELVANVFSSENFSSSFIVNYKNLKELLEYLMDTMSGGVYSDLDNEEMQKVAENYPQFYRYSDGILTIADYIPERRVFNEIYPTYIANLLSYSVDLYLLAKS